MCARNFIYEIIAYRLAILPFTLLSCTSSELYADFNDLLFVRQINACGVAVRTLDEIRRKWSHLQFCAKRKASAVKRSSQRTGGGVNETTPLTAEDEKILSTMHHDAIEGVEGGIDTSNAIDTPPPSKKTRSSNKADCCDRLTTLQEDMNSTLVRMEDTLNRIARALESMVRK